LFFINTSLLLCCDTKAGVIPEFTLNGLLPQGVHWATWTEFTSRFGRNDHRKELLKGLAKAMRSLKIAGCSRLFIDGSFVTDKMFPSDYDGCWDIDGVNPNLLHPFLLNFDNGRELQKAYFKGELFPSEFKVAASNNTFLDFFQTDKNTGVVKGIVGLKI
jgi:hypothetical protein